jgi:carboxyl-terminal processing protease
MLTQSKRGIYKVSIVILGFILFATACKKDPVITPKTETGPPAGGTREELTKDSIFLYAKQTYYWNDALPTYDVFKPRSFSSFQAELDKIKTYKINPATGKPIDKYSFLDDGSLAGELGGAGGDYGFSANFNNGDRSDLRIRYVYANSPAASQNVKRGQQIIKINGSTAINGDNVNFLNAAIFGNNPSISMTLRNLDGSTIDVTVTRGSYSINPVLFSKVYTVGAKKVGYIVFNSFTTNASAKLDDVFSTFSSAGISEVIVDLRYNGGGSVSTAETMTNLIAPAASTGQVMYTTYWTKTMQDGQATILKNQKFWANGTDGVRRLYSYFDYDYRPTEAAGNLTKFAKRGAVNVTRAYFIVTGSTASASELVINNLKPVMDVKLIGHKTYGKPVGFFALTIDQLDLYIPQFETKNSKNEGGYFDGMAVDKDDYDDVSKDFGDPSERLLANALSYAEKGAFLAVQPGTDRISSTSPLVKQDVEKVNEKINSHYFKGMVETKLPKLKPQQ